jgi:fibronectin type 3 domain-containing protein
MVSVSAPIQHTVTLSWSASASTVTGYNIYRSTISGGPYTQVNTALESALNYVDNTVQSGQRYYYVVTSVDSSGKESAFSNQVIATIPVP